MDQNMTIIMHRNPSDLSAVKIPAGSLQAANVSWKAFSQYSSSHHTYSDSQLDATKHFTLRRIIFLQ